MLRGSAQRSNPEPARLTNQTATRLLDHLRSARGESWGRSLEHRPTLAVSRGSVKAGTVTPERYAGNATTCFNVSALQGLVTRIPDGALPQNRINFLARELKSPPLAAPAGRATRASSRKLVRAKPAPRLPFSEMIAQNFCRGSTCSRQLFAHSMKRNAAFELERPALAFALEQRKSGPAS